MTSPRSGTSYTNMAQDSEVNMQVGVMHGDAHFYNLKKDDPQEKYRVGLNYLRGNAHRQAEKLIREAFMAGYRDTRVAYYWTLAILGGRSFDHLEKDDFAGLSTAFELLQGHGRDRWRSALAVVYRLVRCLAEQESRGKPDPAEFGRTMSEFDRLPPQQREEIRRHLDMILAGGIQDLIEARYASELGSHRMSNDRRERAWKFFHSDPAEPVLRVPKKVTLDELTWLLLVPGIALAGLAVALVAPALTSAAGLSDVGALLLCCGGGFIATKYRWLQLQRQDRCRQIIAARKPIPEGGDHSPRTKQGRKQANLLKTLVDVAFDLCRPKTEPDRTHWERSVKGIRNAVKREILDLYGDRERADQILWLIMWHARETFGRWKSRSLPDLRAERRAPRWSTLLIVLGSVATGIGLCTGITTAFSTDWPATLLAVPFLGVGVSLTYCATTRIYLEVCRFRDERDRAALDHEKQQTAYEDWRRLLANRPDDSEMARWLDYDKAHVKQLAMRRYKLTNRDVLAHAILTEARSPCARARVLSGPPRYSMYVIRVFLLTEGGVRQFAVEMNFRTGMIGNEQRAAFHYGAFASAMVVELGMRLDEHDRGADADKNSAQPSKKNDNGKGDAGDTLVLSRTFRLSLVNNQLISVRVENFDEGLIDRLKENPRNLLELALDVAGINGALRILESVAAEGPDWIERERRRRDRRLRIYQDGVDPRNALPPAA
jgi:hypothetical protein